MPKPPAALLTPEEFEAAIEYMMPYTPTAKEICWHFFVAGLPTPAVAERAKVTRQYVVKTIARFAEAHGRYVAAWHNLNKTTKDSGT